MEPGKIREAKKATLTDVVVCCREQIKATCSPTCPPSTASSATAPRWGCSGPGRSSTPRTERCRYGSLIYLLRSTISTISRYIIYARMTTMWTNFVKFGNPTPDTGEWSKVTKDDIRYR